jgi:hypothetical protein
MIFDILAAHCGFEDALQRRVTPLHRGDTYCWRGGSPFIPNDAGNFAAQLGASLMLCIRRLATVGEPLR